jgi:uncharacterized protein (TIGR02147 family)
MPDRIPVEISVVRYIRIVEETKPPKVRVFDYLDYRDFLRARYQSRKRENPAFSYRYIASRIGLDSGTITRILKGERNLDPEMAGVLAKVFHLNDFEKEYFQALVLFCQAKNPMEKNLFLEKVLRLRGSKVKTLEERQYEFYRKWYLPALRELLNFFPYDGNPQKLARALRPSITPQEAREAVKLLQDLGLVEPDGKGGLRLTEKLITSGDAIRAVFIHNLQVSMAELGARALFDAGPHERDFSGLTLSLSPKGFQDIKDMIKVFRRDVLERARRDADVERVYQVNFQFFPLSRLSAPEAQ